MRPAIACLLLTSLTLGACDRQSEAPSQATPSPAATEVTTGEPGGRLDRSHAGEAAPDIAFEAPDGRSVTLADFRGTPVLLNLWATWCAPCIAEMPTLDALAAREGDALKVLTVSQDLQGAEKVEPFFAENDFEALEPYLDPQVALSTHFAGNLPVTILYDAEGREVWRLLGGRDWADAEAQDLIGEAS